MGGLQISRNNKLIIILVGTHGSCVRHHLHDIHNEENNSTSTPYLRTQSVRRAH